MAFAHGGHLALEGGEGDRQLADLRQHLVQPRHRNPERSGGADPNRGLLSAVHPARGSGGRGEALGDRGLRSSPRVGRRRGDDVTNLHDGPRQVIVRETSRARHEQIEGDPLVALPDDRQGADELPDLAHAAGDLLEILLQALRVGAHAHQRQMEALRQAESQPFLLVFRQGGADAVRQPGRSGALVRRDDDRGGGARQTVGQPRHAGKRRGARAQAAHDTEQGVERVVQKVEDVAVEHPPQTQT